MVGGIASSWLRLQLVTGLARSFRDFTHPIACPFWQVVSIASRPAVYDRDDLKSVTFGEQPLPFQDVAADISTVDDSAMNTPL